MIDLEESRQIHRTLIKLFGGLDGIRDLPALKSALARPFQTFDHEDLHPTPIHKAASLIESILINHPFIDGNKRTGYVALRSFLLSNGLDIVATQEEKYAFVIDIASGNIQFEQIVEWLNSHTAEVRDVH